MPTWIRRLLLALAGALLLVVPAGCGAAGDASPNAEASLLLDFTPNAIHAGIYLALDRDFSSGDGVDLDVRAPVASSAEAIAALRANKVDFAVLDLHDLALADQNGQDLVGVMALVQQPLASVVAQPSVARPRDLEGRRVGVSGLPSDQAVLRSIVRGDGGDPSKVRTTDVGFRAVQALLSRKVAGATAFWNAEGDVLRARRPGTKVFKLDDFGAPSYPELVLAVTRSTLQERAPLVQAVVSALIRGYRESIIDPETSVTALVDATDGLKRPEVQRQLDALLPLFQAPDGTIGTFDRAGLEKWARWERSSGIVDQTPDVADMFAFAPARKGAAEAAKSSGE